MATIKDKIGLAMLPSAQSGGASTDTTDYSGTVHSLLPIQYTGPNVIKNGTFDTNSDWTLNSGWSYENGVVSCDGTTAFFTQTQILEVGKTYLLSYEIKNYQSGSVRYRVPPINGNSNSGNGVYTEIIKANSTTFQMQSLNFIGSIDNISVKLISKGDFDFERSSSATRVGSDGYVKNVEVLSDELVQNGDFEDVGSELVTYSDFSYGSGGWSLVDGKWTFDDTAAGYLNYPSISVTVGQIYKVVVDVSVPSGVANFRFSSGNAQTMLFDYTNFSDGITTFYTKVTGVNGGIQRLFAPTTLSDAFTLNSISIKEVGQNWTFIGDATMDGSKGVFPAPSQYSQLTSSTAIVANKKYRFSADINFINAVNNSFGWRYTGGPIVNINSSDVVNGKYSQEFTAPSNGSFWFQTVGGTYPGVNVEIDNVSLIEVTDDTDIPRLDFSNAAQPSLLLEPERINYFPESEFLDNKLDADLTQTISDVDSPIKNVKYLKIEKTGGAVARITPSLSGSGVYTYSAFFKQGSTNGKIAMFGDSYYGTSTLNVQFDLSTGEFTDNTGSGLLDYGFEDFGSGSYRVWATFNYDQVSSGTEVRSPGIYVDNSQLGLNEYIYITGMQCEEGSYPTSYIPTKGTIATRNADLCKNAGNSTIFNDAEGVLFAEVEFDKQLNYEVISISDGSSDNSVNIGKSNNGADDAFYIRAIGNNGSVNAGINGVISGFSSLENNKIAIKYGSVGKIYINGKDVTSNMTTMPNITGLNSLDFLQGAATSTATYGKVRQLLYFPEALTDAELERLTSSDITQVLRNYNRRGEILGATYESAHVQTKLNELF